MYATLDGMGALPELPPGPTLTPTPDQIYNPDLLKFVINNQNIDLFNAAKAPIAGETFGVPNTYLFLGAGVMALLAMGSRR